jgi:hypothetical protein
MNTANPLAGRSSPAWPIMATLLAIAVVAAWFLVPRLHYFVEFSAEAVGPYFSGRRAGLLPHVYGGLVALAAGLLQLWLGFTRRTGAWHMRMGRVYVAGISVGALGGLYLAFTIPASNPLSYRAGLFFLCVAWIITTGMALRAIHLRRIPLHRDWMLRSYTVTLAFVFFRIGESLLLRVLEIEPRSPAANDIASLMAWACWAVPLLVAEPLIQLRAFRR